MFFLNGPAFTPLPPLNGPDISGGTFFVRLPLDGRGITNYMYHVVSTK